MKDRRQKTEDRSQKLALSEAEGTEACPERSRRDRRQIWGYIIGLIIILFLVNGEVIAVSKIIKGEGTLTSVEDGIVIIDEKGYKIDPSVTVIDKKGKKTTLHSLSIPTKVYFEYEYSRTGFVIKQIEEFPEILPK